MGSKDIAPLFYIPQPGTGTSRATIQLLRLTEASLMERLDPAQLQRDPQGSPFTLPPWGAGEVTRHPRVMVGTRRNQCTAEL